MGLVRVGHRHVHDELADLLADPVAQARMMAARAIAYAAHDAGASLLRLKALSGDREPGVVGECLLALAKLAPARSIEFLRPFLSSRDETIASSAALALGEMRRPDALAVLRDHWQARPAVADRSPLALPIALARLPEATDFLVDALASAPEPLAIEVVRALKMYRGDGALKERIRIAITARALPRISDEFARLFP